MYILINGKGLSPYGICMALAVLTAMGLSIYRGKKNDIMMEDVLVVDAMSFGFALAGAKILYVAISYSWTDLWNLIKKGDFSFIGKGGFVFLGGLLFGLVGAWLGAKLTKRTLFYYESALLAVIPIVHSIGRVGCLLSGCCYGRPYDGFGAVYYYTEVNGERYVGQGVFPIQVVEIVCNLILATLLIFYTKKAREKFAVLRLYLVGYSFVRFVLEFFRGDEHRGRFGLFYTSQWISMGMIGVVLLIWSYSSYCKKAKKA